MTLNFGVSSQSAKRNASVRDFDPSKLRELRTIAGISVSEVAVVLGVRDRTVERYEAGTMIPRNATRVQVERILAALSDMRAAA